MIMSLSLFQPRALSPFYLSRLESIGGSCVHATQGVLQLDEQSFGLKLHSEVSWWSHGSDLIDEDLNHVDFLPLQIYSLRSNESF